MAFRQVITIADRNGVKVAEFEKFDETYTHAVANFASDYRHEALKRFREVVKFPSFTQAELERDNPGVVQGVIATVLHCADEHNGYRAFVNIVADKPHTTPGYTSWHLQWS